ncbi:MAG: hypothetical protein LBQ24_00665 [Candidatus Peribacteria bacterium]|nr:hypothetical protein [Candidatus Peribacteria bacterium]
MLHPASLIIQNSQSTTVISAHQSVIILQFSQAFSINSSRVEYVFHTLIVVVFQVPTVEILVKFELSAKANDIGKSKSKVTIRFLFI